MLTHARYRAGDVLGRGAQGVVVRVVDAEAPQRPLVAKLWTEGAFSEELLAAEFALLARVRAPGLVRARDLCRDEKTGSAFLVEDFIDGPDAAEWLAAAENQQERANRLATVVGQVATTLAALHDAGFVHGDLKPAHVRVSGGRAVLLDLGAAVESGRARTGPVGLTRSFAAPEIRAGAHPAPASDLYGLGALAWALATGEPPGDRDTDDLRRCASWVLPSFAGVVSRLLEEHPRDRPEDARAVLREIAIATPSLLEGASQALEEAPPLGRESELKRLLVLGSGVHYLAGPPGIGKSHLLREAVVRVLLEGRDARLVSFPCDDTGLVRKLIAFLRGADEAWPFRTASGAVFLALDDFDRAPEELKHALEAFRCRPSLVETALVVASTDAAPDCAPLIRVNSLSDEALEAVGRELGVEARELRSLVKQADGNVGWLLAAIGRVPLGAAAARERVRRLSVPARTLLATISLLGGDASEDLCRRVGAGDAVSALAELCRSAIVTRRSQSGVASYALSVPSMAADIADSLASFDAVDRLADCLLEGESPSAAALLSVAGAGNPPARRAELLRRAAHRARLEGLRSAETDALIALAADPKERTGELLLSLDRVTRGGGSAGLHPELVGWLEVASKTESRLRPVALRRRAEQHARAGDFDTALDVATSALDAARTRRDPGAEALALSTEGSIALYRADWAAAEDAVGRAVAMIASGTVDDAEEIARLDHNRGVVALYRERVSEAIASFEKSLASKRAMGDRGGVWACLVNLGLALGKSERFDEAERAFEEALALTRSMKQPAGTGWCLVARAEVLVRKKDPVLAERALAEAEQLGDALPASVRADLDLVRAEVRLLEGDGRAAMKAIGELDQKVRDDDALVDSRAFLVGARALLLTLPVDRRGAARRAIAAIRRAREGRLPEPERDATAVLRSARSAGVSLRVRPDAAGGYHGSVDDERDTWGWLESLPEGSGVDEAAQQLARLVVTRAGAERAFVVLVDAAGTLVDAWGADMEGLAIDESIRRVPSSVLSACLDRSGPVYQREVATPGGNGSVLAVASGSKGRGTSLRAAVVVEHRFVVGRFDSVPEQLARRWVTLAGLLAWRGATSGATSSRPVPHVGEPAVLELRDSTFEATTSLPIRESRRQFSEIVGSSPALRAALARLDAAVDSELPLLITGETGVGKERFARAVHDHGQRARGPFIAVSCAAIPETLFEAELFGHARGSFTGADRSRPGLLARAEGGTLFLDEVGELPLARQAVLLRALETRTFRPVGADSEKPFDVRIVAATNRDLDRAADAGTFRQDLLYRLNVLEVGVPALRDRVEDIGILARRFLDRAGSQAELAPSALAALEAYPWPGNVRELEHQVQRLAASRVERIERKHLPRGIRGSSGRFGRSSRDTAGKPKASADAERVEVREALDATDGNITHAAKRLGITRHGLKKKMVRLGLRQSSVRSGRGGAKSGEG